MNCAFVGADKHGLLVVPLEFTISTEDGLTVMYPYGGHNLDTTFKMLRAVSNPDIVLQEINRAAVHLLLGLWDVHSKVSTLAMELHVRPHIARDHCCICLHHGFELLACKCATSRATPHSYSSFPQGCAPHKPCTAHAGYFPRHTPAITLPHRQL